VPFEVIALDRDTALLSEADIRQIVLCMQEGDINWPRMPVEIDDLDQLSDVLDSWGIVKKPSALDVQNALDRHEVWVGRGLAVRQLKKARRDR
jgi:hypothetical protein